MLSKEENERLSRVGPGTPTGELLRRYWHPILPSVQLQDPGTKPVRLLGEDLVLFRDRGGKLGLVDHRCPHRRAGMVFGIPEQEGLRCAYHGWLFDETGRCLEQPFESTANPDTTFKDRVGIRAYPVEELGGMIFAYLGPLPAPMVPRWDLFVADEAPREVGGSIIPCNWLQITENSLDPVHVEWLHQYFANYVYDHLGQPERKRNPGIHQKIRFEEFEHGITKLRLLEDESEDSEDWTKGHPHVFPNILKSGSGRHPVFQIRVPIDDTHTQYWWYSVHYGKPGEIIPMPDSVPYYDVPVAGLNEKGELQWDLLDNHSGQDMVMWYTQGEITDREEEHLGASDTGVIAYRKQLSDNIARVARGEDPMNTFRDPAQNVCLHLHVEEAKLGGAFGQVLGAGAQRSGNSSKYSVLLRQAEELAQAKS